MPGIYRVYTDHGASAEHFRARFVSQPLLEASDLDACGSVVFWTHNMSRPYLYSTASALLRSKIEMLLGNEFVFGICQVYSRHINSINNVSTNI